MIGKSIVWLIPLLLAINCNTFCQIENFQFREIENINASEVIKGIIKDDRGVVWLATDRGILRYDGTETKFIQKGLSSNYTKQFELTHDNRLLVISDLGLKEIIEIDDSVWLTPYQINDHVLDQRLNYPKSIFQDSKNRLWIGESDAVCIFDKTGFKRYKLGPEFQSISYHRTFSFAEDAFGHIWIAPYKGPMLTFNEETDSLAQINLKAPLQETNAITCINGDYLFIGGHSGLVKLKVDSGKNILEENYSNTITNISTLENANGKIFIGTWNNGVYELDFHKNLDQIAKIKLVRFDDILDFHFDKQKKQLWLTGSENIGVFTQSIISIVRQTDKFRVESISTDEDIIYFSSGDQVLKTSLAVPKPTELLEATNNYFDCLLVEDSILWIGDSFGAIFKYNTENQILKQVADSTGHAIKYIHRDRNGNKWFAGDPYKVTQITVNGELIQHHEVKSSNVIKTAPDGGLYCGGYGINNFLLKFDINSKQFKPVTITFKDIPPKDLALEDLDFDDSGNFWLATNYGLHYLDKKALAVRKIEIPGLRENETLKAVGYFKNIAWLATAKGLIALNGNNTILLTKNEGLPSKTLKERGIEAYENKLLIATAKGLASINPNLEVFKKTQPPLYKTIVANRNKRVSANNQESIILPYNTQLQADFLTLTYPGNDILYQSRVIGIDKNWSEPSTSRAVSFLGFKEGNYTLEVRAKAGGQLWSDPSSFQFTIAHPWFKKWWAYLIFAMLGIVIIAISMRLYNYSLILQKRRLKKIIDLRTVEINKQKNEIIEQKNRMIEQKEELIKKSQMYHKTQQALSEADLNFLQLKEKQLRNQIEYRDKQITTHALNIIQKNETLKELKRKLEGFMKSSPKSSQAELKKTLKIIDESFRLDKDWEEFKLFFEQIYTGFYTKLKINCPELTTHELRHCALIRLNLSTAECASILGIASDSVKVSRARIRKKLDLEPGKGLADFILSV